MKKPLIVLPVFLVLTGLLLFYWTSRKNAETPPESKQLVGDKIELPAPDRGQKEVTEHLPIETALEKRRSIRNFSDRALKLQELTQLLWAAQGITNDRGFRTAPSAGALYPLEIFAVVEDVKGLGPGVYRYVPKNHSLERLKEGKLLSGLASAALGQRSVQAAAATLVVGGIYERTTQKYTEHGRRYVHIEVGHAAQNVYLQAESLGLGTVDVGAFQPDEVRDITDLPDRVRPLLLMPLGKPAASR